MLFVLCRQLGKFIAKLFEVYMDLHFTYLEINPLVVTTQSVFILDLASRLDQTAEYLCASKWGKIEFPPPFGRDAFAEVEQIYFFRKIFTFFSILGSIYCGTRCQIGCLIEINRSQSKRTGMDDGRWRWSIGYL